MASLKTIQMCVNDSFFFMTMYCGIDHSSNNHLTNHIFPWFQVLEIKLGKMWNIPVYCVNIFIAVIGLIKKLIGQCWTGRGQVGLANRKMMLERRQESQNCEETWKEARLIYLVGKGTTIWQSMVKKYGLIYNVRATQ